jgi:pimeloyl-ACP methyl ester carboxylesterase
MKVISNDGTPIAYDRSGQGPALILVGGALGNRSAAVPLASLLARHLTVFAYDRRGRGDSGDTQPFALQREIEDIEALVQEAGGSASLYGHSSGACLALEAALKLGARVERLAMYEPPYNSAGAAREEWKAYTTKLAQLLASDRRGDAVELFMRLVGVPGGQIEGMRQSPMWPGLEAAAPTLAYDAAAVGADRSVPTKRAAEVTIPTLVMNGGAGYPFMYDTALALSRAIPDAQLCTLEGQDHAVDPQVLAPVLLEFFARSR